MVILSDVSGVRGTSSWIDPLPNVLVPTNLATPCSWRAPASISDADAEPPSTRTIICNLLSNILYPLLRYALEPLSKPKSSLTTTFPVGRNQDAISQAAP